MPIDSRQAQLTAINEALRCLDLDCIGPAPCDGAVEEAVDILLDARERLTAKPWPELPLTMLDPVAYEAWMAARIAEQIADGRQ